MRDDEIGDELEEFPSQDPTSMLEQLEAEAGLEDFAPGEPSPPFPPLSPREIDDAIDQVLDEELARLSGSTPKKKD